MTFFSDISSYYNVGSLPNLGYPVSNSQLNTNYSSPCYFYDLEGKNPNFSFTLPDMTQTQIVYDPYTTATTTTAAVTSANGSPSTTSPNILLDHSTGRSYQDYSMYSSNNISPSYNNQPPVSPYPNNLQQAPMASGYAQNANYYRAASLTPQYSTQNGLFPIINNQPSSSHILPGLYYPHPGNQSIIGHHPTGLQESGTCILSKNGMDLTDLHHPIPDFLLLGADRVITRSQSVQSLPKKSQSAQVDENIHQNIHPQHYSRTPMSTLKCPSFGHPTKATPSMSLSNLNSLERNEMMKPPRLRRSASERRPENICYLCQATRERIANIRQFWLDRDNCIIRCDYNPVRENHIACLSHKKVGPPVAAISHCDNCHGSLPPQYPRYVNKKLNANEGRYIIPKLYDNTGIQSFESNFSREPTVRYISRNNGSFLDGGMSENFESDVDSICSSPREFKTPSAMNNNNNCEYNPSVVYHSTQVQHAPNNKEEAQSKTTTTTSGPRPYQKTFTTPGGILCTFEMPEAVYTGSKGKRSTSSPVASKEERDLAGHYDRLANEIEKEIKTSIDLCQADLKENKIISDEVSGHLRVAIVRANSLLTEQINYLRNLCTTLKYGEILRAFDRLPEGYEVSIDGAIAYWKDIQSEIDSIRSTFSRIDQMRKNEWNASKYFQNASMTNTKTGSGTSTPNLRSILVNKGSN